VFTFDVYTSPKRTTKAGSAVLTCQYYFDKNGFCDETIQLKQGTLFAVGPFSFDAKSFALVVTGGSGGFAGVSGDLRQSPGGNRTERLTATLIG
jgi:hypothetical protein